MNIQKSLLFILVLGLIAGTAACVKWIPAHQRLGTPGIKAFPTARSVVMKIDLPERVLDYVSTNLPTDDVVLKMLPPDTSYAQRLYEAPDRFTVGANIILMGTDRTSIHKPEFCLPGHGWSITKRETSEIAIEGPEPYQMPVAKWTINRTVQAENGAKVEQGGLYVFWLVADNEQAVKHNDFIRLVTWDLLRTGVLQRWAYVSYIVACTPGQEDATFERLKKLITASVPEFQLPPRPAGAATIAKQ
jgi:Protein of unknown function (DUF3485)